LSFSFFLSLFTKLLFCHFLGLPPTCHHYNEWVILSTLWVSRTGHWHHKPQTGYCLELACFLYLSMGFFPLRYFSGTSLGFFIANLAHLALGRPGHRQAERQWQRAERHCSLCRTPSPPSRSARIEICTKFSTFCLQRCLCMVFILE
jgi:hypothetical protein